MFFISELGGGGPGNGMEKKTRTNAVYITCLPDDVTEDKVTEVFGAIGMIKTSKKTGGPSVTLYNDKRTDKFKVRLCVCVKEQERE